MTCCVLYRKAQSDSGRGCDLSSLPTTPSSGPFSLGSPVPVPNRVTRDRVSVGSMSSTPQISLTEADSEVYSSSISSAMSFQQSEESSSRPLSPAESAHDPEQSFYGQFEHIDVSPTNLSSPTQHYPVMQGDLTASYYPTNATKTSQHITLAEASPNSSPPPPSIKTGSYTSASGETFLVLEQSHADLHRSAHFRPSQNPEELSSAGLDRDGYTPPPPVNTPIQDTSNHGNEATSIDDTDNHGNEANMTPPQSSVNDMTCLERTLQPVSCDQVSDNLSSFEYLDNPPVTILATPHRVSADSADSLPPVTNGKHKPAVNNTTSSDRLLEDFIDGF